LTLTEDSIKRFELFTQIFNSGTSDRALPSETWNISTEEWQCYEFLGDRVLNLVAPDDVPLKREGNMTKLMGVVSNESLAGILERKDFNIALMIRPTADLR